MNDKEELENRLAEAEVRRRQSRTQRAPVRTMYCSLEFPSCGRPVFTTVAVARAFTAPARADQPVPGAYLQFSWLLRLNERFPHRFAKSSSWNQHGSMQATAWG